MKTYCEVTHSDSMESSVDERRDELSGIWEKVVMRKLIATLRPVLPDQITAGLDAGVEVLCAVRMLMIENERLRNTQVTCKCVGASGPPHDSSSKASYVDKFSRPKEFVVDEMTAFTNNGSSESSGFGSTMFGEAIQPGNPTRSPFWPCEIDVRRHPVMLDLNPSSGDDDSLPELEPFSDDDSLPDLEAFSDDESIPDLVSVVESDASSWSLYGDPADRDRGDRDDNSSISSVPSLLSHNEIMWREQQRKLRARRSAKEAEMAKRAGLNAIIEEIVRTETNARQERAMHEKILPSLPTSHNTAVDEALSLQLFLEQVAEDESDVDAGEQYEGETWCEEEDNGVHGDGDSVDGSVNEGESDAALAAENEEVEEESDEGEEGEEEDGDVEYDDEEDEYTVTESCYDGESEEYEYEIGGSTYSPYYTNQEDESDCDEDGEVEENGEDTTQVAPAGQDASKLPSSGASSYKVSDEEAALFAARILQKSQTDGHTRLNPQEFPVRPPCAIPDSVCATTTVPLPPLTAVRVDAAPGEFFFPMPPKSTPLEPRPQSLSQRQEDDEIIKVRDRVLQIRAENRQRAAAAAASTTDAAFNNEVSCYIREMQELRTMEQRLQTLSKPAQAAGRVKALVQDFENHAVSTSTASTASTANTAPAVKLSVQEYVNRHWNF